MKAISGSIVAIVTPMFEDGSLDLGVMRNLVDHHVQEGTDAIVVVGTTGESPTVTEQEHKRVIEMVVQETAGQVPVIAGACSNNPREAIAYAHSRQLPVFYFCIYRRPI